MIETFFFKSSISVYKRGEINSKKKKKRLESDTKLFDENKKSIVRPFPVINIPEKGEKLRVDLLYHS